MGYSHFSKIASTNGFAVGAKGSETDVVDSNGAVTVPSGQSLTLGSTAVDATATELNTVVLTTQIADISGNNSAFVVSPVAGTLSKVYSVIDGAIGTGDETLTVNVNGGTDVTNTITITQSGSAAGDVDSCTPGDYNTVAAENYLKITSNGDCTNSITATISFVITL